MKNQERESLMMKQPMTRRQCCFRLAALALPFATPVVSFSAQTDARKIRIVAYNTFVVQVNARGNWVLVRLASDAGITGLGEASHGAQDALTLKYLAVFAERLKGRSIFDTEWLRSAAAPEIALGGTSAACALSALEQCLWDIIGQALNVPVYELFGGALRTAIRNYANINRSTDPRTPAGFAAMAERAVNAGFTAVKLAPWDDMPADLSNPSKVEEITQLGIERATAVRRTLGPGRDLLLDAHSKFDLARGLALPKRLEPLKLFWLEEVTPVPDLPAIRRAAPMPSAGGETIYGAKGFLSYINARSVDIVMPDVKYCGGMLELKKIASLAEAAGLQVSPPGPASPVGNIAAAHVCAGMPNFLILEHAYGEVPWRSELIDPPEQFEKGSLELAPRPGLGIRLNERTAAKYQLR
jgi:galactonate dehydratase